MIYANSNAEPTMIKDIVVNLTPAALDADPAGRYAISLAEAYDAHITGVAFAYDPPWPPSSWKPPSSTSTGLSRRTAEAGAGWRSHVRAAARKSQLAAQDW